MRAEGEELERRRARRLRRHPAAAGPELRRGGRGVHGRRADPRARLIGPRAPRAQQTGSWARTAVPSPAGLADHEPAAERLDAVGEAAQPRAAALVGAADAVVDDLDRARGRRCARRARAPARPARTWPRWSAPRRRRSRPRPRPSRAGARRAGRRPSTGSGARSATASIAAHRPWSVSTAGCSPRASSRSSSSASASSSPAPSSIARSAGIVGHAAGRHAHGQRRRDQPLLGAVVEVALQAPALGVAGLDDAHARGGELLARLGVGDGLGGEVGEVADAELGLGREGGVVAGDDHRAPQRRRAKITGAPTAALIPVERSGLGQAAGLAFEAVVARRAVGAPDRAGRRCRRRGPSVVPTGIVSAPLAPHAHDERGAVAVVAQDVADAARRARARPPRR